jgi:mannose-6-phosphate isomerase-like protein (cupin superfamily)
MDERRQAQTLFHMWGTAKILYSDANVTVKELTFVTLGKTSLHYHLHRHETLYVQTGTFSIRVFDSEKDVFNEVILKPGMTYTFARGYLHQIKCMERGILIETTLTYEEEDVMRIFDESLVRRGPSMR